MRNTIALNAISEILLSRKSKIKYLFGLMLCVFIAGSDITAAPSDPDPTFGTTGASFFKPYPTSTMYFKGMALQPDGKIVTVGAPDTGTIGFPVVRFNANGSVDTTFGTNGVVSATFGGTNFEQGVSVAVQPDGKIVVGGHTYFPGPNGSDMAVLRLNSDGSIDTAFGVNGVRVIPFTVPNGAFADRAGALKIAPDGKIVIVGQSDGGGIQWERASVARLNADGSFDTTFGDNGRVLSGGYYYYDVTIQPDGSIVAAGYYSQPFIANSMIVHKYNSSGAQVWSYFRGGPPVTLAYLYGIAAQADGKFIVVGEYNAKVSVSRLNADGTLDNSFNANTETIEGTANGVAVQNDGKIVVAARLPGNYGTLFRFNSDGLRDRGFGINGLAYTSFSNGSMAGLKVIIQPDEKILVGGNGSTNSASGNHFVVARFVGGASAPLKTPFDYDGDGRADVSVFRPSENRWYILKSSDSSFIQPFFGAPGDVPTPADYDGDGKTDLAIFRPSSGDWWYQSSASGAQIAAHWGQNGDIPRPSDFDGDGKTDYVFYRPAEGKWYRLTGTGITSIVSFGTAEDKPVIGDFDGDGKSDPAIFRPSTGVWWYAASGSGGAHRAVQFGISTDIPVPADYDGDGKTDIAVYRASEGGWHILRSSNLSYYAFPFGDVNDKPVAADYDGDGKADAGVFRPSNGSWYLLRSTSGYSGIQWGASTDIPTENSFIQ